SETYNKAISPISSAHFQFVLALLRSLPTRPLLIHPHMLRLDCADALSTGGRTTTTRTEAVWRSAGLEQVLNRVLKEKAEVAEASEAHRHDHDVSETYNKAISPISSAHFQIVHALPSSLPAGAPSGGSMRPRFHHAARCCA